MAHIAGPNHTQIPNIILDSMADMGNAELRVVLAVCRKTFGWQKRQDYLSLTQIQILTGLSRQGAIDGIAYAINNEWITRRKFGQSFVYSVCLEESTSQASRPELVKPVDQFPEKLVKPVDTQKKVFKEKKSGGRKERPPRALTPLQQEQKHLEQVFAELSGIPFESANKIWHITTQRWIKSANGRSEEVMRAAFAEHSKSGLDIKGPQSIDYKFWAIVNHGTAHKGLPEL